MSTEKVRLDKKIPHRIVIKEDDLKQASIPVTDDMRVGEYKKILSVQTKIQNTLRKSLPLYLKQEHDVDISSRKVSWCSYTYKESGGYKTGKFIVTEWLQDERSPAMKTRSWEINKSKLIRAYKK